MIKVVKQLKYFLQNDEKTIKQYFVKLLKSKGYKNIINTNDYLFAAGEDPIALTAHLDTVFYLLPKEIYYDQEQRVMWSPDGLGADDRLGIWLIHKVLIDNYKPTIILTTDEEKGNLGAMQLVTDIKTLPVDIKYIIGLDRRGKNDAVFYQCANAEFEEYITSFGFQTAQGSFSDISTLCPIWQIAGVNLSVGYYNEHSYEELIKFDETEETFDRLKKLLDQSRQAPHFEYIDIYSCICNRCKKQLGELPIKDKNNKLGILCIDCLSDLTHIEWCGACGHAYIPYGKDVRLCQDCIRSTY